MISIITCTYNRAKQLERGLKTILSQPMPTEVEIVVMDDGSSDNTREICANLKEIARPKGIDLRYFYINHPEPRISCIPRNIGIKQATGDIIMFTEPEALHVGNTIQQMFDEMNKNPEYTIVASQVWTTQAKIAEKLTEEDYADPQRILNHPYAMLTSGTMQNTNAPDSDWAITGELHCNAGVFFGTRKQWLLDVGGFDESFEGHGFDDFDLFARLALSGHGALKVSDIPVIHQWHEKNYPYNIYEAADKNGKISESRVHVGEFRANIGKDWGVL